MDPSWICFSARWRQRQLCCKTCIALPRVARKPRALPGYAFCVRLPSRFPGATWETTQICWQQKDAHLVGHTRSIYPHLAGIVCTHEISSSSPETWNSFAGEQDWHESFTRSKCAAGGTSTTSKASVIRAMIARRNVHKKVCCTKQIQHIPPLRI